MDYDSTPINVTFKAGTTNTTVNIPVIMDNITEMDEYFSLNLTIPSSLKDLALSTVTNSILCLITDNTSKNIRLGKI